jgi:hypothetical protein
MWKVTLLLNTKDLFSTGAVEICVEISVDLWKSSPEQKFSTFHRAQKGQGCGNVGKLHAKS